MNKISDAFKGRKAFIAFVTAGDPDLEITEKLVPLMAEAGADIIELGIPFSDPIAEGPVIQEADERALAAGTTTDKLFESVKRIRERTDVPLAFMTYMNPIFVYGTDRFISRCAESGVNAVIVPDVPFEERDELMPACRRYGVELISLIAPTSTEGKNAERAKMIASAAEGFIYCVSSLGVTGVRSSIHTDIARMVSCIKASAHVPCAVGFGIGTPEQAHDVAAVADGVIVGSAIVKLIAAHGANCIGPVCDYVRKMKDAVASA